MDGRANPLMVVVVVVAVVVVVVETISQGINSVGFNKTFLMISLLFAISVGRFFQYHNNYSFFNYNKIT